MCRTRDQCTNHKSLQKHTNPRTTKYNKLDASCGSRRLAFPNCRHAAHKGNLVLSLPPAASLSSMPNTSIHCPKAIFPLRVYRGSISGFSGGYALFPNISANNTSRWLEMDPELLLSFGACFHIVRAARCSSVHVHLCNCDDGWFTSVSWNLSPGIHSSRNLSRTKAVRRRRRIILPIPPCPTDSNSQRQEVRGRG